MCLRRLLILCLFGCAALTSCGSSHPAAQHHSTGTIAVVGSSSISQRAVQDYMTYALRFYSWVDATQFGDGTTSCAAPSTSPACVTLRQQVVRRLAEEQVVAAYAAIHHIELTARDTARVERELQRLRSPNSGTARLFTSERISPAFMRTVLRNQLLVKRVEAAVVGKSDLRGPSFRLRKFVFGADRPSYRRAVDLATGGSGPIAGQAPPVHWVAAYRLPTHLRSLIQFASNGDFVGPTLRNGSYVVYQVLGRGVHRYGLPARQEIEARVFRTWLTKHISSTVRTCSQAGGGATSCRPLNH